MWVGINVLWDTCTFRDLYISSNGQLEQRLVTSIRFHSCENLRYRFFNYDWIQICVIFESRPYSLLGLNWLIDNNVAWRFDCQQFWKGMLGAKRRCLSVALTFNFKVLTWFFKVLQPCHYWLKSICKIQVFEYCYMFSLIRFTPIDIHNGSFSSDRSSCFLLENLHNNL